MRIFTFTLLTYLFCFGMIFPVLLFHLEFNFFYVEGLDTGLSMNLYIRKENE
jgi:hypothetical protein